MFDECDVLDADDFEASAPTPVKVARVGPGGSARLLAADGAAATRPLLQQSGPSRPASSRPELPGVAVDGMQLSPASSRSPQEAKVKLEPPEPSYREPPPQLARPAMATSASAAELNFEASPGGRLGLPTRSVCGRDVLANSCAVMRPVPARTRRAVGVLRATSRAGPEGVASAARFGPVDIASRRARQRGGSDARARG